MFTLLVEPARAGTDCGLPGAGDHVGVEPDGRVPGHARRRAATLTILAVMIRPVKLGIMIIAAE
jgi:hypothetical protein